VTVIFWIWDLDLGFFLPFNDSMDDDKLPTRMETHAYVFSARYHNLICDMWRELERPIDFDSPDPNLNPVVRPEFLDPPLTALGMQQCSSQRDLCNSLSPDLVIVSPMLRCIQTAKLSFRDHVNRVPWVSHEGCREELGLLVGNKRRPITEIKADYPEIDFGDIEHDEDVLWDEYGDRRETLLEKSERIYKFLTEYVRSRPEKDIAIVCHSAYLFTLLNAVMDIEEEELRSWFLTSEVRSLQMTFVDRDVA
jgi:broad specificity phosphatase PhoE